MYREPTRKDTQRPLYNAIWNCIKTWDINVPDEYDGYQAATGNHVCALLDAVDYFIHCYIDVLKNGIEND